MNITEIAIDKEQAREAFEAYRASVRERHSHEDEAIMRGYKALAQGKTLIHLRQTIMAGGTQTHTTRWGANVELPNLAICRAHVPWCWVNTGSDGSVSFQESDTWLSSNARHNVRRLPAGTLGNENRQTSRSFKAMVPVVPAGLRPKPHLRNYHILWEAEWEATPPVDPYLLKHIGGDLYAVLAQWDLTELERAVMTDRIQ